MGETDTDGEVLAALVEDLDAGFATLVRAYERAVYSVALRVSGRPADAEDLASEAFLRAYRALQGYEPERIRQLSPRSWLLTIVLNLWRNALRDAGRRPDQVPVADPPERAGGGPSVEEQVEGGETRAELGALVAELPENQRVAVVLRHVVGMPIAEVAATMRCAEGTAKSHVSRGLRRIRELYTGARPMSIAGRRQLR
ncbi:RNA polymerase sigma factor [Saccharopolyspora taberi]|uniref:RNA polymerase sigma factor n=1 Tax=Saccharopolyspora taberi TaxID=60895 RepID=A0ABN3VEK0_9PSEU